jgi:3-methyladenine DNA glycosylase AlkD
MPSPADASTLAPSAFVDRVREILEPLANPVTAEAMQAYLRGQFTFLGIQAPGRRDAVAALGKARFDLPGVREAVDLLWALPHREYRYTAVDLLARHQDLLGAASVPWLLNLARVDPWWETVDGLTGVVGDVLRLETQAGRGAQRCMDEALGHPDFWIRRIAMTHQLGWRLHTDTDRLFAYATTLAAEEEFFIRKAIGWALRDYARWDPDRVKGFLEKNRESLSALTVREASRNL